MSLAATLKGWAAKAGQVFGAASPEATSKPPPASRGLPLGIDFGTGGLKVLELVGGDQLTLGHVAYVETPDNLRADQNRRLEFQAENLAEIVRSTRFRTKRAACAIPAWATVCKQIQLGKPDGTPLSQQVLSMIPQHLNCDPSTIIHRYLDVTPPGASRPEVIVMAVTKELIGRLMQAMHDAKLEPVGMHSEFMAELAAYDHIHVSTDVETSNSVYVDIGAGMTRISISHGRTLAFVRTIDMGGAVMDQTLVNRLGCTMGEARAMRWKHNEELSRPGLPPAEGPAATTVSGVDLAEAMDIIADEVRMSLRLHASKFPTMKVDRLVFLGGECRSRLICNHIARVVRMTGHTADPFRKVQRPAGESPAGLDLSTPQPAWALAMGVCLSPTDL